MSQNYTMSKKLAIFSYSFLCNRNITKISYPAASFKVTCTQNNKRDSGEHHQSICSKRSEVWYCKIILQNWDSWTAQTQKSWCQMCLLYMCSLVVMGPVGVFDWCLFFSLWQHLWSIAVAPCLLLLLDLLACSWHWRCGDSCSLCVRRLFL